MLPLAAVVVGGLVWLGERNQARLASQPRSVSTHPRRLAPRVELYDQSSQLVKFERYLGRTKMAIVFFDGEKGADADPWLSQLRDHHAYVVAAGAQVIGIGMATPYANRQAGDRSSKFPFPILSDIGRDRPAPAHTAWGRFDPDNGTFLTGLFLVDRSGMVEIDSRGYVPVRDPSAVVKSLCEGKWPE